MSSSKSSSKAGDSSSISASFLELKADLERSKASSSASTSASSSSAKRKALTFDREKPSKKKLSSSFLDSASCSSRKPRYYDIPDEKDRHHKNSRKNKDRKGNESDAPSSSQFDRIRSNLERKARIYDQLSAGKYAGISTEALKESSIDWDRKLSEPQPRSSSPPASPPLGVVEGDDPEIEYIDEFGRTRKSRLSEVPRDLLPAEYGGDSRNEKEGEEVDNAIYGPATSFPVYDPELYRRQREESRREKEREGEGVHFDADFEKRHHGAAFYRFSKDEELRKKQMADLGRLRDETRERRGEKGSNDYGRAR